MKSPEIWWKNYIRPVNTLTVGAVYNYTLQDKDNRANRALDSSITADFTGAPNVDFRKISVWRTIWDLEFSEHLLQNFLFACLS